MENELWLRKGKKFQRCGPDGLEAWGVAIAAAFINFIMAGINRATGILYVEFIDAFQTDRMQASLPFTIRSLTRNLLGPVVGIFGQKYGVRPVMLVGGVISTLSTVACFFFADIFWISVFWGCINGLGGAMILTLTQAAIGEHFVKHISTASGIGLSGGCFGSFVFPAMFESLIEEYTIQGTFLFIAGMIMHVIPASIIMKKPTWIKNQPSKENKVLANGNTNSFETGIDTKSTKVSSSNMEDHDVTLLEKKDGNHSEIKLLNDNNKWFTKNDVGLKLDKNIDINFLWEKRELICRLLTDDNKIKFPSLKVLQADTFYGSSQIKDVVEMFCKIAKNIYSDSSTANGDINFSITKHVNASENVASEDSDSLLVNGYSDVRLTYASDLNSNPKDCLLLLLEKFFERDKEDIILLFPQDTHEDLRKIFEEFKLIYILLESNKCISSKCDNFSSSQLVSETACCVPNSAERSNTFCSHIKTAMWLHTKPLFLLTCLCRCAHFLTFMPILTAVVDFSRDKGLPEEYGKFAIGTLALGDLFGRLFSGWLTDKNYLSLPRYMFIFMVLQGIFTIAIALTNSTESLLSVLTIYGLIQGCTFIRHPVLISHYMGKDEQSIALGCLNFFPGVIGFAMPFYIGYFRDTVGSYNGIFYINGSIGAFIGFLWLAEPYLLKCSLHFPQRRQKIPV